MRQPAPLASIRPWGEGGNVGTTCESEDIMGIDDKLKNAAEDAKGKAKEAVGKATDDEELQAEGEADQTKASLKKAGENVKDAFKR